MKVKSGMIFLKRELYIETAAEEASRSDEGEHLKVKLSGKRTGKRTAF